MGKRTRKKKVRSNKRVARRIISEVEFSNSPLYDSCKVESINLKTGVLDISYMKIIPSAIRSAVVKGVINVD